MLLGERFAPLGCPARDHQRRHRRHLGSRARATTSTHGIRATRSSRPTSPTARTATSPRWSARRSPASCRVDPARRRAHPVEPRAHDAKGAASSTGSYAKNLRDQIKDADGLAVNRSELLHELDPRRADLGPVESRTGVAHSGRRIPVPAGAPGDRVSGRADRCHRPSASSRPRTSRSSRPSPTLRRQSRRRSSSSRQVVELIGLRGSDIPAGGANDQLVKHRRRWRDIPPESGGDATTLVRRGSRSGARTSSTARKSDSRGSRPYRSCAEDLIRRTSIGLLNKIPLSLDQISAAKDGIKELQWVEQTKRGADAFVD